MTSDYKLPEFPTTYTEEEAARLKELEEKKGKMAKAYGLSPEQWKKKHPLERAFRRATDIFAPSFAANILKIVTPSSWGFKHGLVPEDLEEKA